MAAKVSFWTRERVELACEVLGRHVVGRSPMQLIAAEFNRLAGSKVSTAAFEFAVKRCTGKVPTSFMRPRGSSGAVPWVDHVPNPASVPDERPTNPEGRPLERDEAEARDRDEIPIDESEFEGVPPWRTTMPEGQRLKGNSTLEDGEGNVDRRWVKTERDSSDPPAIDPLPPGHIVRGVSTMLDSQGDVRIQWLKAKKEDQVLWEQFCAATERHCERYRGLADPVVEPQNVEGSLTVYPLGDPHVGMLAWGKETTYDFDAKIAERELIRCVDLLVDRAPRSSRAILANLGDFWHAEGDDQLTPRGGNKLDVDNRWAKLMDLGFSIMRRLTDRLLEKHREVEVVNVPGNHDPKMARMLTLWMKAVYEREPRVVLVPNENPFIYRRHGFNLIGFAHGDGAKMADLPEIMATDQRPVWGETEFHVWLTGHIHQNSKIEAPGCTVESFRTLAPRDMWAHHKGYRSGQSLSAITYDPTYGEVFRSTVDIKMVKASA